MSTPVPVKRELGVLYVSVFASRVGFGVIILLFPYYISRATDIEAAVSLALYPLLEAVTALFVGRLCDTRGRRAVFLISVGYVAALLASIGLTTNLYVVSSIHALLGIGAAGVTVATLTMVTDLTGASNRGKGMGAFDFANVGGYAAGLLVGTGLRSFFADALGEAFFATGAVVGVAFLLGFAVLKETPHPPREEDRSLNPFKAIDRETSVTLPVWFGVTILLGMVFFLPRAFTGVSIGGGQTALIFIAGLLVLGVGAVGFGALSDKYGRGKVLVVGIAGLYGLLFSLLISFDQGGNGLYRNFPEIGLFAILTSALVPTILATVGDRAVVQRRGSAMGLYSVMISGGTAVGTLVAGLAHTRSGLPGIIEAGIVLFTLACIVSLLLWTRNRASSGKAL